MEVAIINNPWKGTIPFPSPEEAGDPDWDNSKLGNGYPKTKTDEEIEEITAIICDGLVEDGFDAIAHLYGKLSVVTVEYSTYKFNVTVKEDTIAAVVADIASWNDRLLFNSTLHDPEVFCKLANAIKAYEPSYRGQTVSQKLDNKIIGRVMGGFGHTFDT